nr:hypothetical protein [Pandoravirus massiliensis]
MRRRGCVSSALSFLLGFAPFSSWPGVSLFGLHSPPLGLPLPRVRARRATGVEDGRAAARVCARALGCPCGRHAIRPADHWSLFLFFSTLPPAPFFARVCCCGAFWLCFCTDGRRLAKRG